MDEFWKSALKYCGSATISGLLIYTIYPSIISSPALENLSQTELFALMAILVVATFIICVVLINAGIKPASGGNTITIKNSTVMGGVRAGDKGTDKAK